MNGFSIRTVLLQNNGCWGILISGCGGEKTFIPLAQGQEAMGLVLHLEAIGGIEAQTMFGLHSCSWIFSINAGHQHVTNVVFQLASTKSEIALSSNVDFGPFFQGSPTVSELHSFARIVDHWVGVVRVDSQGWNLFSWHCLNDLPSCNSFLDDVLEVGRITKSKWKYMEYFLTGAPVRSRR